MYKSLFTLLAVFTLTFSYSQDGSSATDPLNREASFADYDAFKTLVNEVEAHRAARMISLERFNSMSKEDSTIILDTRSKAMYDLKHIKGAVHLNFSDFTQQSLWAIAPNKNIRILIYCNNNFLNDQIPVQSLDQISLQKIEPNPFATKVSMPTLTLPNPVFIQSSEQIHALGITMALNIPTYINLYGYGYRNVYELKDLVSVYDASVEFEGTMVETVD